jgi:hypothetical protein
MNKPKQVSLGAFLSPLLPATDKAGQFHTCPRGVAHSTRAAAGEEIWLIAFFTDPLLQPLGDRVMIDE